MLLASSQMDIGEQFFEVVINSSCVVGIQKAVP